ncbi:MAG: hypothetical protein HZA10_02795 [Nitrospirae bacterium]|nr:hypothetical protein [Nitrospirota bacterium]
MMVICVTGAHSGVGKTTLCSILLRELKGFGAIKFTKTELYTAVVDDIKILSEKGKDTAIFLESGAGRVIWVQSPYDALEEPLQIALSRLSDLKGIIVEGNSPVDFLNPHLVIFIIGAEGEIKPSAMKVLEKADVIVINSREKTAPPALPKNKAVIFCIDLEKRTGEIDEFLTIVKKRINREH